MFGAMLQLVRLFGIYISYKCNQFRFIFASECIGGLISGLCKCLFDAIIKSGVLLIIIKGPQNDFFVLKIIELI